MGAGAGVVAVLEVRYGAISPTGKSMHPISGGGGKMIAGGGSRSLSTLGTVGVMAPSTRMVLAWGNGYDGLSE